MPRQLISSSMIVLSYALIVLAAKLSKVADVVHAINRTLTDPKSKSTPFLRATLGEDFSESRVATTLLSNLRESSDLLTWAPI